ncbi:MAG: iron-sulfur cluster repair di-iron protein [Verrucomicrobiae bacterium]|nr:iron-sulfur cluster repair di-iron protein [Verrucomicrobiae bacterium]
MTTTATSFQTSDSVGAIVTRKPALARIFEQAGIDYCCGGKKSLEAACREKGLDPQKVLAQLEAAAAVATGGGGVDAAKMTLTELADHIQTTHHAYLKAELPRLEAMTKKVAAVHGEHDPRLPQVKEVYLGMAWELKEHTLKEEQVLFPMIRELDAAASTPAFHCGSLAAPIRAMELEHDSAGGAIEKIRELTDGFTPPEWACNTYRAMLDALALFERDLHQHVHKENNILFPRAIQMEEAKRTA